MIKKKYSYFPILLKMFTYEVDFVYVNILSHKGDFGFNVMMFKFMCKQLDHNLKNSLCNANKISLEEFSELKSQKNVLLSLDSCYFW